MSQNVNGADNSEADETTPLMIPRYQYRELDYRSVGPEDGRSMPIVSRGRSDGEIKVPSVENNSFAVQDGGGDQASRSEGGQKDDHG